MVTKKKVKSVEKTEEIKFNKPIVVDGEIKFFKPEFGERIIVESVKYDVNYLAIRRKIIKIGKNIKLIRESKPERVSFWQKYCNWFNSKFNVSVIPANLEEELYNIDKLNDEVN